MRPRIGLALTGALLLAALILPIADLTGDRVTTKQLGGEHRVLSHLATDRPMYRPGETLLVRAFALDAFTRAPQKGNLNAAFKVLGPKGDVVASGMVAGKDGSLGLRWPIPKGTAGGPYTVRIEWPNDGWAPAERTFDIRAYRAPRLNTEIEFARKGYGPGDAVAATLTVARAEGGIPTGARVDIVARVDGRVAYRGTGAVDAAGRCAAAFPLPAKIAVGEGSLAMIVSDGGVVETASKTIPILLQTLDLAMYPEGGALVGGLESRVYLQARTPWGKPADVAGEVIDPTGSVVAKVATAHEGRGVFGFTPKAGVAYRLRLTAPAGIRTQFALPEVAASGAVIRSMARVTEAGKPVQVSVAATTAGKALVTLMHRERLLSSQTVTLAARAAQTVALDGKGAAGALVATVWSADGKTPLAERVVFRQPARAVKVEVTSTRTAYVPGESVTVTLKTTDAKTGAPVSAMVGVDAVDDRVLEMVESRERAPRLVAQALLESEVGELADAHVYLDANNPEAPEALDLLLGTQAWRRFAFVDSKRLQGFLEAHEDRARRVLAITQKALWGHTRNLDVLEKQLADRVDELRAGVAEGADGAADDDARPKPNKAPKKKGQKVAKAMRPAAGPPAAPPREAKLEEAEVDAERAREQAIAGVEDKKVADQLKRIAGKKDVLGRRRSRIGLRNDFVAVRVYAHAVRDGRRAGDRVDFAETLYWNAGITTDAESGTATFTFGLCDSVTRFRVRADAVSASGALGGGDLVVESVEPFFLAPKVPFEVTAGDTIELPVAMVNGTPTDVEARLSVSCPDQGVAIAPLGPIALKAGERGRAVVRISVGQAVGELPLVFAARAGAHGDTVTRSLKVVPRGFPANVSRGGMLEPGDQAVMKVSIPADRVPGSLRAELSVYPSPLAKLTAALERLIRDPYGCFEQTSSTTYPLVMAQQYFLTHQGVDPKIIRAADEKLGKGYKRLIGFECKSGGFEWFGKDPGHEALTAYGLLEFSDMSKVRAVDSAMIARTRKWLLAQRDGKGAFSRKRRALHTWITDPDCSNAYILWALLESGDVKATAAECKVELAHLEDRVAGSDNAYVWALAGSVMKLVGKDTMHQLLCKRLAEKQGADGKVSGGTTSIVGSRGLSLDVEVTALAVMSWLRDKQYMGHATRAARWLASICEGGRYGSTQATVLALRAIVAYDASQATAKAAGALELLIDGKPAGKVAFAKDTSKAIVLPDFVKSLKPGDHELVLRMTGGSSMPYALSVDFHRDTPDTDPSCAVTVDVEMTAKTVKEGELVEAMVTVRNTEDKVVPTPIAIVGIPGGAEPRHDQLKELVGAGKIAAYEVIGRSVVLYWRSLKAGAEVTLPISLVGAVPGTYTGPASRAYLYYGDEAKHWKPGRALTITAR